MAQTHILNPADVINAQRCSKVINKINGNEFVRDLDPRSGWVHVYQRASMHPEEFDLVFDKTETKDGKIQYSEPDLKGIDVAQLQQIATSYGVGGRGKRELIANILGAQSETN
jgi:hypothetical protein